MNILKLEQIRDRARTQMGHSKPRIVINTGTSGIYSGANQVLSAIKDELHKRHLDIQVVQTGSIGLMEYEPIIEIITPQQGRTIYTRVTPDKARAIIANHLVNHNPIKEWIIQIK